MLLKNKWSLTTEISKGRMTLKIPKSEIVTRQSRGVVEAMIVEMPDDWFCWLYNDRPVIGGEKRANGSLYLSRKGWEANKDAIRKIYEDARFKCLTKWTWEHFERYAERLFREVEEAAKTMITVKEQELDELRHLITLVTK